jgi:hypothetical protein
MFLLRLLFFEVLLILLLFILPLLVDRRFDFILAVKVAACGFLSIDYHHFIVGRESIE